MIAIAKPFTLRSLSYNYAPLWNQFLRYEPWPMVQRWQILSVLLTILILSSSLVVFPYSIDFALNPSFKFPYMCTKVNT